MRRLKAAIRGVALVMVATLMLSGCIFPGGSEPDGPPIDSRLYLGPIPDPAPLPPLSDRPPMPTPPVNYNDQAAVDEFLAAMELYAASAQNGVGDAMAFTEGVYGLVETAKQGGAGAVAAWQSLYVAAGIAVAGVDGNPIELNGKTGSGWPVSDAELRIQAVMGTSSSGLHLVEIANALKGIPELAEVDVATALYEDLSNFQTVDVGFNTVLYALNPSSFFNNGELVLQDQVFLNWGQVGLVLRRLSAEVLNATGSITAESPSSAGAGVHMQPAAFTGNSNPSARKPACTSEKENPWANEGLKTATKLFGLGYDKFIDNMVPEGAKQAVNAGRTIARVILAFLTMLTKAYALDAKFSMSDSPLVRTRDTHPGQVRDLTITFEFNSGTWSDLAGCLNLLMTFTGFELPAAPAGPAKDVSVDLTSDNPALVRIGDGKGGNTPVTRGKTNGNGEARFKLSGAPQVDLIPEQAEIDPKLVRLLAESNLESNDFFKDISSLPWSSLDAFETAGLSMVPMILSRVKILSHAGQVPVQDWKLEADFEVTAVGSFTMHESWNWQSSGCGGPVTTTSGSIDGSSSFASDPVAVSALLLSNPQGNLGDQAVVFVPKGDQFFGMDFGSGPLMFELPAEYSTEKSESKPAIGKVPPVLVHAPTPSNQCASGEPQDPPTPECGLRTYPGVLQVSVPAPRKLHLSSKRDYEMRDLWKNCGPDFELGDPPMAPGIKGCTSPKITGGQLPDIEVVFDLAMRKFTVSGTRSCHREQTGYLSQYDYNWTLVFCRIVEGKPAC